MAAMVLDYEKVEEGKGLIQWAISRIHTTAPTINEAERKIKGALEATQYKQKRMIKFVLEKNNLSSTDFTTKKTRDGDDDLFGQD